MWTKWVTIHESFGMPRAAEECRHYLEHHGIRVRLRVMKKQSLSAYALQVPEKQAQGARERIAEFKRSLH